MKKEKKAEASFQAYRITRNLGCKFNWKIGKIWEESYLVLFVCIEACALKLLVWNSYCWHEDSCTNYVEMKKCVKEKYKKNEEHKVIDAWKWNDEEECFEVRKKKVEREKVRWKD
jgi:hypothetical protein